MRLGTPSGAVLGLSSASAFAVAASMPPGEDKSGSTCTQHLRRHDHIVSGALKDGQIPKIHTSPPSDSTTQ